MKWEGSFLVTGSLPHLSTYKRISSNGTHFSKLRLLQKLTCIYYVDSAEEMKYEWTPNPTVFLHLDLQSYQQQNIREHRMQEERLWKAGLGILEASPSWKATSITIAIGVSSWGVKSFIICMHYAWGTKHMLPTVVTSAHHLLQPPFETVSTYLMWSLSGYHGNVRFGRCAYMDGKF